MDQNHIQEIICKILLLQQKDFPPDQTSCDRPYLGPALPNNTYNTRPVQFYNAYTAKPWAFPYLNGDGEETINVFRIESFEGSCVTVRLLSVNEDGEYTSTNQFVTISFPTIGAICCFDDVYLSL